MNTFRPAETTMTPEEAEAVARRFLTASPADATRVADLADALEASPEEVERLLGEVRAERKGRLKRRHAARLWTALALLVALAAVCCAAMLLRPAPVVPVASVEPMEVFVDGQSRGPLVLRSDEAPTSRAISGEAERILDVDVRPMMRYEPKADGWEVRLAREGRWDEIGSVRQSIVEVRKVGTPYRRWVRAVVPVYDGENALLKEAVDLERNRRIERAVAQAPKD